MKNLNITSDFSRPIPAQKSRYGTIIKPSRKLLVSLVLLTIIGFAVTNVLELISVDASGISAFTQVGIGIVAIALLLFFGQEIANAIRNT